MVKTTLFDYSNCSGIRILRNFMNESCAGQVKIVGDRLRLSSGCPSDQSSSLAYFLNCELSIFSQLDVQNICRLKLF